MALSETHSFASLMAQLTGDHCEAHTSPTQEAVVSENDDQKAWIEAAECEAATLEGGEILAETYTFEEYVYRRGDFLCKHPFFSGAGKACFPRARVHASEVYDNEQQHLGVEEVRVRELAARIDPLLPLPTTANTETVHSFAYAARRVMASRADHDRVLGTNLGNEVDAAHHRPGGTFPVERASLVAEPGWTSNIIPSKQRLGPLNDHSAPGPEMGQVYQSAIIAPAPDSTDPEADNLLAAFDQSGVKTPECRVDCSSPARGQYPGLAEIENEAHQSLSLGRLPYPTAHNEGRQNNSSSGSELHLSSNDNHAHPQLVMAGEGVSSLSDRGIHVHIKTRRVAKCAAAGGPVPEEVPSKQKALSNVIPDAQPDKGDSHRPAIRPKCTQQPKGIAVRKQKSDRAQIAKPIATLKTRGVALPKPKLPISVSRAATGESKGLEAIVSGATLPLNRRQATAAAKERRSRLLAKHVAVHDRTQSGRVSKRKGAEPDLPPEFFDTRNFQTDVDPDVVRCVCGAVTDDGATLIACDQCGVWQHIKCMGNAVPEDTENGNYACQVCDPWEHRELIQQLRMKQNL